MRINPAPFIGFDRKPPQYYKGIRIKTDTGLHDQLMEMIEDRIGLRPGGKKLRALDFGCGEGALSQRLFDAGWEVVSSDIDSASFKAAGPVFRKVDINDRAAVEKFLAEFPGGFDLILAVEVIEHVKNPWDFMASIRRVCSPHTHLIVTTPNISSWWARFMFLVTGDLWGFSEESWNDPGHINPVSEVEMRGIFRESGFECRDVWPGGVLPVIWPINWKRTLISLAMLPVYLLMKGRKDGWALCFHAVPAEKKP